ncbi:site-specific integrase [Pseudomonas sp. MPFS]|uniref:site-specific integrase n=1 Tax=Pseudomonas sp. MPFS TaxID=2795724 RepID=UPI001F132B2C|nr:site-specific integrase [Pseudomonas sp. MPFS]UMZ13519.1 site-specific integrase [Pseudomonas sp. MPFS]
MSELTMSESERPEAGEALSKKELISLSELSDSCGLPIGQVLRGVLNYNIPVVYEANSQPGFLVDDFSDIDRESETEGFVLNSAIEVGTPHVFRRLLKPFVPRTTLLNIIEAGASEEVVFRLLGRPLAAAFFDLPGIRLTTRSVLILKVHAGRFFRAPPLSASGPISTLPSPPQPSPHSPPAWPCECCRPDRAEQLVSSLMEQFLTKKQPNWKLDQQKKMATQCGAFVELMRDPPLGALNRQLIWDYEATLRRMPADRYNAARRHGTQDANQLLALAEEHGELRLSSASVERYLDSLSSMFAWAVDNMILTHNPAKRAIEKQKKVTRDQDDRLRFEKTDLDKIFSAHWFSAGTGERNKHGRFHQFRPHFYWLPLLALYTGARLNELSQLYITDLKLTNTGVHYLDFNLDGPDKLDADEPDKSLKTVNSQRIVALHPHIIELELPAYVKALSGAGYSRLFPELKRDEIKGYGKPAGSWFNERFLGKQLAIPRDGKRTFHSFRHTFITALSELGVPPDIQAQLAGHSRGETITAVRYRKDADAERLLEYVKLLDFKLPAIKSFVVANGLEAVKDAWRLKTKPRPLSDKQ